MAKETSRTIRMKETLGMLYPSLSVFRTEHNFG